MRVKKACPVCRQTIKSTVRLFINLQETTKSDLVSGTDGKEIVVIDDDETYPNLNNIQYSDIEPSFNRMVID